MKSLLLDTTFDRLLVAVNTDGNISFLFGAADKGSTSSNIIPKIKEVLEKGNLDVKDLDCIFVVLGPGSFTGIRIGVCTAEAIAFGVNAVKCGLSVFDGFGSDELCVIPSRRGYYYFSEKGEMGEISESELTQKSEFFYRNCLLETGFAVSDEDYVKNLFAVAEGKIKTNCLTPLEPLYLKKSQAERLREEKK